MNLLHRNHVPNSECESNESKWPNSYRLHHPLEHDAEQPDEKAQRDFKHRLEEPTKLLRQRHPNLPSPCRRPPRRPLLSLPRAASPARRIPYRSTGKTSRTRSSPGSRCRERELRSLSRRRAPIASPPYLYADVFGEGACRALSAGHLSKIPHLPEGLGAT